MARAPFDRTIDLIWGPGWPDAGNVRVAAMPARVVPDLVFREPLPPMGDSLAYVTFDQEPALAPAFVVDGLEQYIWLSSVADRVAMVSGAAPTHYVVRLELRTRLPQPSYWRAHIAPIPSPLTPCQLSYPEAFKVTFTEDGSTQTLSRIGPTTWIDGATTLELETGPGDPTTCFWPAILYRGSRQYTGYWDPSMGPDTYYFEQAPPFDVAFVQPL